MSNPTITWNITTLEREVADGFVYSAAYTVDAHDGTYSSGAYGSVGFERPEELIPYADLTKEEVIGWVQTALGEERVEQINAALAAQIEEQRSPTKAAGVPWS